MSIFTKPRPLEATSRTNEDEVSISREDLVSSLLSITAMVVMDFVGCRLAMEVAYHYRVFIALLAYVQMSA